MYLPHFLGSLSSVLRRDVLRRLYPNAGVPLAGREHGDCVQELVDAGQQVLALLGFVGNVVEHLVRHDGGHRASDLVIPGDVGAVVSRGSEKDEEETGRDRNLGQVTQVQGLVETDKSGNVGTGIGLATVKKVVNSLEGEISVVSELGSGSTFTFQIKQ